MDSIQPTGRWLNIRSGLKAMHALYRFDGKWYHHLRAFPGALFDRYGYVVFATRESYERSTHLQHRVDLHVPGGIASMPGYVRWRHDSASRAA